MKPGDKVWLFDISDQTVKELECDAVDMDDNGNELWAVFLPPWGRIFLPAYVEAFPTREALCEHYRKIFE